MICEFGDVVIVPFPFLDQSVAKRRPALVLSGADFNGDNGQSILAMITTASRSSWPWDVEIKHPVEAGLLHKSVLRWKLFTMPNDLILRRLGGLGEADRASVAAATTRIFPARRN